MLWLGSSILFFVSLLTLSSGISSLPPTTAATVGVVTKVIDFDKLRTGYIVGRIDDMFGPTSSHEILTISNIYAVVDDSSFKFTNVKNSLQVDVHNQISVTKDIDQQVLCGDSKSCVITAKITGKLHQSPFWLNLKLDNETTNSFYPNISVCGNSQHCEYQFNVSSLAIPGDKMSEIYNISDNDSGLEGELDVSIEENAFFRFDRVQDNQYQLSLTNKTTPAMKHIELRVKAVDRGNPSHESTVVLNATIVDNQYPPHFKLKSYAKDLGTNRRVGDVIVTLEATDRDDLPRNRRLYYFLAPDNDAKLNSVIDVGKHTGVVTLKNEVPAEYSSEIHKLKVLVNNGPGSKVWDTATLTLQFAEKFEITTNTKLPKRNGKILVSEGSAVGQELLRVEVEDSNTGRSIQQLTWLKLSQDGGHFALNPRNVITIAKAFDAEAKQEHRLTVTACSMRFTTNCVSRRLRFWITDVNEYPPQFTHGNLKIRVLEDANIGDTVASVKATDADLFAKRTITYKLLSGTEDFQVSENDGAILVNRKLDYEEKKSYQLLIEANDHGGEETSLKSQVTVNVQIVDVNDNPPLFTHPSHSDKHFYPEDGQWQPVIQLTARDRDSGFSGQMKFGWDDNSLGDNQTRNSFTLDQDNGKIYLKDDRPQRIFTKQLYIQVSDKGLKKVLSSQTMIYVHVVARPPGLQTSAATIALSAVGTIIACGLFIFAFYNCKVLGCKVRIPMLMSETKSEKEDEGEEEEQYTINNNDSINSNEYLNPNHDSPTTLDSRLDPSDIWSPPPPKGLEYVDMLIGENVGCPLTGAPQTATLSRRNIEKIYCQSQPSLSETLPTYAVDPVHELLVTDPRYASNHGYVSDRGCYSLVSGYHGSGQLPAVPPSYQSLPRNRVLYTIKEGEVTEMKDLLSPTRSRAPTIGEEDTLV